MFSTYLSRGLFKPRPIFARINGPIVSLQEASQTCTGIQEQSCSDQVSLQEAIQPCTLNQKQLGTNKNPGNSRGNFYKLRQGGNI